MKNSSFALRMPFLLYIFVIGIMPLKGQVSSNDSIYKENVYRSSECRRAMDAINSYMPYTAIEIIENLQKKYKLNNLECGVLSLAYNKTHAYDKTIELYKNAALPSVSDSCYNTFLLSYIKALSKTKDYREAIALRERAIISLEKRDTYLDKAMLAELYFDMADDYISMEDFDIWRKWMDEAVITRMKAIKADIREVAKGEIVDKDLASFFTRYYVNMLLSNPTDKENDLYLALSAACGNVKAVDYFHQTGKSYKRILRRFIKKNKLD